MWKALFRTFLSPQAESHFQASGLFIVLKKKCIKSGNGNTFKVCQSWDGTAPQEGTEAIHSCSVVPTTGRGGEGWSSEEAPGNPGVQEWNQGSHCRLAGARSWPGSQAKENRAPCEVWALLKVHWGPPSQPNMFSLPNTRVNLNPSSLAHFQAHLLLENPTQCHAETSF